LIQRNRNRTFHKKCPYCGGKNIKKTREIIKDELDYKIVVEKKRRVFDVCHCNDCQKQIKKIPK
jgi:uncharacterized protein with PIN domain